MAAKKQTIAVVPFDGTDSFQAIGDKGRSMGDYEAKASRVNPGASYDRRGKIGNLDYIAAQDSPFFSSGGGCSIDVSEMIKLCKQSFYHIQVFRNAIISCASLCNTGLVLKGKNQKMVKFYQEWLHKIGIWNLSAMYFLEYFRSGNVFLYTSKGKVKLDEVKRLGKLMKETVAKARELPLRYTILNPESIRACGALNFTDCLYEKLLSDFEVSRLRDPQTPGDIEFAESFTEEERKQIISGINPAMKLKAENLVANFCNKMDYEPMAVPPFVGALKSINLKLSMRNADLILQETIDQVVLLFTCGTEAGILNGTNQKLVAGLTGLLSKRGASRIIVSDFSTKGEFLVPDLNKVMGSAKYESLDVEIANSLMDLFSLGSTGNFSSSYVTTQIYLELLKTARESFLNMFLIPEMEKIADTLGFDTADLPVPSFEEISLESQTEKLKLYTRLYELGYLTPESLADAFENKGMPVYENILEQQKEFKKNKDAELFIPVLNAGQKDAGRPDGTTGKKSKVTNPGPQGSNASEDLSSLSNIRKSMSFMEQVFAQVETEYKKANNMQRLNKKHKEFIENISVNIISSETPSKWSESVAEYIKNPFPKLTEQKQKILELSSEFELPVISAALLYFGKEENVISQE